MVVAVAYIVAKDGAVVARLLFAVSACAGEARPGQQAEISPPWVRDSRT